MSWTAIRPYFISALEDQEFSEWPDGFAFDNIPSNLLDHAFHITLGSIAGIRQNQTDQESEMSVAVRCFFKGYADPAEAIDSALAECESLVKSCVNVYSRVSTPGLLNVVFNELTLDPLDGSNDNAIVATLTFSVRVILDVGP